MVKIETVSSSANSSAASSSRISAHTHISGLGLDENGDAIVPMVEDGQGSGNVNTSGLVGQVAAREALGIVSDLVHSQRLAGRALLLVGPPGMCGKIQNVMRVRRVALQTLITNEHQAQTNLFSFLSNSIY